MSLKSFISKYKQQNKSSMSSTGNFSNISTNSFASQKQQSQNNNSQNSFQKLGSQQNATSFLSQNMPSSNRNPSYHMQDEANNLPPFQNNSFQKSAQSQNYNQKQNLCMSQILQEESLDNSNMTFIDTNGKESFYIQNPVLNNSLITQNQNSFIQGQSALNQSQLVLPTIFENNASLYGGQANPNDSRILRQNLNQSYINNSQVSQQQSSNNNNNNNNLNSNLYQMLQQEMVALKVDQQQRENYLKIELLSEIKEIKEYFKENIIEELASQFEKKEKANIEYHSHLQQVHKKVENVVQTIFNFLNDQQSEEAHKANVAQSEYAQDISDLRQLVIDIKDNINVHPNSQSNVTPNQLNRFIQIMFQKINQAKRSVKKQIINSTAKPALKQKRKYTRRN